MCYNKNPFLWIVTLCSLLTFCVVWKTILFFPHRSKEWKDRRIIFNSYNQNPYFREFIDGICLFNREIRWEVAVVHIVTVWVVARGEWACSGRCLGLIKRNEVRLPCNCPARPHLIDLGREYSPRYGCLQDFMFIWTWS